MPLPIWLLLIFAQLSLLAVGGGSATLPEMQRQVVSVNGWMSAQEFAALYGLGQAAPGPNILIVTLVGFHVAGWAGAVMATIGMLGPSSTLTYFTMNLWNRFRDRPWRRYVQAGLVPVTVGLMAAASIRIVEATTVSLGAGLITAGVAACLLGTKVHPLVLLAAGALLGVAGLA